jgi:DNA-directed RNA polymerase subunit RPC12/RpoP
MHPTVHFRCGGCGARIKASLKLIGQSRPCPQCRRRLTVQAKAPEDCEHILTPFDAYSSEPRKLSGLFGR